MLVKAQDNYNYLEDFGLKMGNEIHFYENGVYSTTSRNKIKYEPVVRVNVLWVEKPLKIKCSHIADTEEKKIAGLEVVNKLEKNEGMFFPYKPYSNVSFHQGKVKYPLDLIFIKDDVVCHMETNTKVGSKESWTCLGISSVIEVNAGFCDANNVEVGDKLSLFACSANDIKAFDTERKLGYVMNEYGEYVSEETERKYHYTPNVVHLLSNIADFL